MATATEPKLTALNDFVLIRPDKGQEVSAGGIALPTSAVQRPNRGTVVSRGPCRYVGETAVQSCVDVGDRILFSQYAMQHVEFEGENLLVIRDQDVIAVIND